MHQNCKALTRVDQIFHIFKLQTNFKTENCKFKVTLNFKVNTDNDSVPFWSLVGVNDCLYSLFDLKIIVLL